MSRSKFTKREISIKIAQSLSHSKWECKYHITWIPKYRKKELSIQRGAWDNVILYGEYAFGWNLIRLELSIHISAPLSDAAEKPFLPDTNQGSHQSGMV